MKKKIISMLLVCLMIVSMFPMGAVAEDTATDDFLAAVAAVDAGGTYKLTSNVTLTEQLVIDKAITLDGENKYTITSTVQGAGAILVTADGAIIRNLTVSGPNSTNPGWNEGEYGIKVYNADAALNNVTVSGANAGILVDSANVTLQGNIVVSDNEFGGIEVCKGSATGLGAGKLTIAAGATVTCTNENVPAIWIDGLTADAGTVTNNSATVLRKVENTGNDHKQIYFWTTGNVAAIGNDGYETLQAAVNAAQSNETVKLLADNVALASTLTIPEEKTLTIDFAGKKISNSSAWNGYLIENKGNLTLTGGTVADSRANETGTMTAVQNAANATLKVEEMTISRGAGIAIKNDENGLNKGGTLTVTNSTISVTGGNNDPQAIQNWGTATINSGTFNGDVNTWSYTNGNAGATTINGGTFNGDVKTLQYNYENRGWPTGAATTTIAGGTFKGEIVVCYQQGGPQPTVSVAKPDGATEGKIVFAPNANIVIDGATANNGKTALTNGIKLDGTGSQSVTVKNFAFSTKGLDLKGFKNVTVQNNEFKTITAQNRHSYEDAILVDSATEKVVISGNTIDGAEEVGINCRDISGELEITGNTVKNTWHNSVQIVWADNDHPIKPSSAKVTGNTFENWGCNPLPGKSVCEGRALRAQVDSLTFTGNKMIHTNAPEQFVKITNAAEGSTINASGNYWGGNDPTGNIGTSNTEVYLGIATDKASELKNYYKSYSETALAEYVDLTAPVVMVAEVNGTQYATLQAAVDAATNGQTVKLLKSLDLGDGNATVDGKTVTFDLSGFTLIGNGCNGVILAQNGANVTITGNGSIVANECTDCDDGNGGYAMAVWGKNANTVVTIENGNFSQVVRHANVSQYDMIYAAAGATINIAGGTFVSATPKWTLNQQDSSGSKIIVTGGTFTGYNPSQSASENPVENFVAEGYVATKNETDGTWTVTAKKDYVAQIGNDKYETLAAAVAAAQTNDIVKLLADVTLDSQLTIAKAITLDGGNHTITSTAVGNAAILVNKAAATIQNLTVSGPNTTKNGWDNGEFGIKFYQATGAKLDNVKVTAANAGIQVNGGSVTMTGTINLTGNEFGGIELCHKGALNISGATLKNDGETEACPVLWNDDTKGTITFSSAQTLYVKAADEAKDHYYLSGDAAIGNVGYATLADAYAAVKNAGTSEVTTITLLKDCEAAGFGADNDPAVNYVLDLGTHTLTFTAPGIGSSGYETQAIRVLQGSTAVIKNGKLKIAESNLQAKKPIKMFINQYGNLTLDGVEIDGNNMVPYYSGGDYVVSNCSGTTVIKNSTIIAKDGDFAFDSYLKTGYTAPTVILDNATINGKVELTGGYLTFEGPLTLTNGRIDVDGSKYANGLAINLNGSKITRTGKNGNGSAFDVKSGIVTIKNGTIDCTDVSGETNPQGDPWNKEADAIVARGGNVTLEGLTVTVKTQKGACAYAFGGGKIDIKSGTYTNSYETHNKSDGMVLNQANVDTQLITVTGGTFVGANPADGDDSGLVKSFLADGYISVAEGGGYKVISADNAVAEIGGTKYESLQAAIDAATSGQTVTLLKDVTLAQRVDTNFTGTIDLNSKVITNTAACTNGSAFNVVSGEVTIKNGTINGTEGATGQAGDYAYEADSITVRNGAKATLENLSITIDSRTGACAYAFSGGYVYVMSGSYTNNTTQTGPSNEQKMVLNQVDMNVQHVFVYGGTFKGANPADGDNSEQVNSFLAPGYVAVAGGNGTFTVKEAQVAPMAQVEADDIVTSTEQAEEGKIVVTGVTIDDSNKTAIVSAINDVLDNDAVTNFVETGIAAAADINTIAGSFRDSNNNPVEIPVNAEITTKVSIKPTAAAVEKEDNAAKITELTFDVTPVASVVVDDVEYKAAFQPKEDTEITFRLPVPSDWDCCYVEITHYGTTSEVYLSEVLGGETVGADKYVELSASHFSLFGMAPTEEEPVAKIGTENYTLSQFENALNASTQAAPVVLLRDISGEDLYFEDSQGNPSLIKLTKDVYVDRGSDEHGDKFVFIQNFDITSSGKVVFVNEQTDKKIVAETEVPDDSSGFFFIDDTFGVDIKLQKKDENTTPVTTVAGYYVKVKLSSYVELAETGNDGWYSVPNEEGTYHKINYDVEPNSISEGGVLCTLNLKAINATNADGNEIVTVVEANIVDDISEAMSGVVISIAAADLTAATAKIKQKLVVTFALNSNGVYTYDGNAFGDDAGDYTIKYSLDGQTYNDVESSCITAVYTDTTASNVAPKNVGSYTVKFTVSISGYNPVESASMSITINEADLTITPNAAKTGEQFFVYSGKNKDLLKTDAYGKLYTVEGLQGDDVIDGTVAFESKSSTESSFSNGYQRSDAGTYTVQSKDITIMNGEDDVTANYNITYATVNVEIRYPEYKYAVTEYMPGYSMLYVFVPQAEDSAVARVTYQLNNAPYKFYDVTAFGYEWKSNTVVEKKDSDSTFTGKVYALLVQDTLTFDADDLKFVKYNDKLAATIAMSEDYTNDVNGSRTIDLADAVAVAATCNATSAITEKISVYMATILRADVDRNGKVQIANDVGAEIGDAAQIRAVVAPIPTT